MIAGIAGSIVLDPTKVIVKKARDNTTQLLFKDALYISVFAKTDELLEYLDNITEQVRMIDAEQNSKEL